MPNVSDCNRAIEFSLSIFQNKALCFQNISIILCLLERGVAQPGLEYPSGGRVVGSSNLLTPTTDYQRLTLICRSFLIYGTCAEIYHYFTINDCEIFASEFPPTNTGNCPKSAFCSPLTCVYIKSTDGFRMNVTTFDSPALSRIF